MGAAAQDDPLLYFELRRTGEPIDPLPWLATAELDTQDHGVKDLLAMPDELATQLLQLAGEYRELSRELLALAVQRDELTARLGKLSAQQASLTALLAELPQGNEDLAKQPGAPKKE